MRTRKFPFRWSGSRAHIFDRDCAGWSSYQLRRRGTCDDDKRNLAGLLSVGLPGRCRTVTAVAAAVWSSFDLPPEPYTERGCGMGNDVTRTTGILAIMGWGWATGGGGERVGRCCVAKFSV